MVKNNRKRKVLVITVIVCVSLLVGILGSYAFFVSSVNNNTPEEASVQTGDMVLVFEDGNDSITESLEFGRSVEKTFTIENSGSLDVTARINWIDLVNTYTKGSLTYTLSYSEAEEGNYTPIITDKNVPRGSSPSTQILVGGLEIPANTKYYYKLEITLNYLESTDQTSDLSAILSTHFIIEEEHEDTWTIPQIVFAIKEGNDLPDGSVKFSNPNFENIATTDETRDGLYSMEDDYGTSYYFRGASENNYVKFADFYWRIIRVNGDGSLRMIYDGTTAHANGTNNTNRLALTNIAWNTTNNNDAKFVGYMYGGSNTNNSSTKRVDLGKEGYEDSTNAIKNETPSNMKTQLETWYKTNIADKGLDDYVSDEIFCNDRSIPGKDATGWTQDTGLGYGKNNTAYSAYSRLYSRTSDSTLEPLLECLNQNDAFTKNDIEKGNGKLNQKVGLITADEAILAGNRWNGNNRNSYLYKGFWYWTLTPYTFNGNANMIVMHIDGYLNDSNVGNYNSNGGLAPVINLTPEYVSQMIGDGTMTDPYRVE